METGKKKEKRTHKLTCEEQADLAFPMRKARLTYQLVEICKQI